MARYPEHDTGPSGMGEHNVGNEPPHWSTRPENQGAGRWVTMHGTHVFIKDGEAQPASSAGGAHNLVRPAGFNEGAKIRYNDGRPGHDVGGTILSAGPRSMQVQFDDRARPTTIFYSQAEWMQHISLR